MGSIQFLGLSSGTDWNAVIQQLVDIERRPLDALYEQRNELQFQQSVMGEVNSQLTSFSTTLSNLRFESTFLSRLVEASNSSKVSATAEAGAVLGTYNIAVSRLAQAGRATSGLDGQLFGKVANLSQTETMGIATLTPYGSFQSTRALATTLIKDTEQAGYGGAQITAGDTITITGQLKDTTAVSGTFTFNGDATDTLERLATTIAQVFQGEIAASVGTNGEMIFIETDPSVAGDVTLNTTVPPLGLQFNDNDYSGSTLTFGLGNQVAGAGATSRRLVGDTTFTNAGVVETNTNTDLSLLDQVTGVLDNGDIIRINGTESGGGAIATVDFTYTGLGGGRSIANLITAIDGAFTTGTATYENGKIVLTDTGTGSSSLSLSLEFVDQGAATAFNLGGFTVAEIGRTNASQMVTTASFTVEGKGEHLLSSSDGKAGRIRGTTTIADASNTLGSYITTEFDLFTIDVDGAGGGLDPVTITGLSEYSTLQDLIDAINDQAPAVTAQLVDAGGTYRLELLANEGGRDIRVYDVAGGILDRLIANGQTDLDSTTDDGTNTFAATTDTDDVTVVDWFTPDNGGPMQRRAITADEGSPLTDLIGGVAINGGAGAFDAGVATIVTADSAELNTQQDMHSYLFGSNAIAESPPTKIPALDPALTLAQAGFATTPENASTSPLFHTDGFFTVNGMRITVGDVTTTTVNEVLGRINTSGAGVTAFFDEANLRFYLRANLPGVTSITLGGGGDTSNFLTLSGLLPAAGGTMIVGQEKGNIDTELPLSNANFTQSITSGVFTVNNTKITIDAGVDTLDDVIDKINISGAGVIASYDPIADRLSLAQDLDSPLTATRIEVGDPADTSNFLEAVSLTVDTTVPAQIGSVRQTSQFTVNGVDFERASNSVDDVIDDVTLSLNAVTTGTESITVTSDTDRIESALIDFIVDYNTTMELVNNKPLSRQERLETAELTDEDAAQMTYDEINDYLLRREELLIRDFTSGDNAIRQMARKMQALVTGLVSNDGAYKSIGQIGLSTSEVGGGPEVAAISLGRLLGPTSDREAITQLVRSNSDLTDAINNHADDLFDMFASMLQSRYTHSGTRDLSGGIAVTDGLSFTIGDGENSAEVEFTPGTYSQSQVLNTINAQLNAAGLSSSMLLYYDNLSQLNLQATREGTQSLLQILDRSSGTDSLLGLIGWETGVFFGPDPEVSGGIAQRTRDYISQLTGVGGIVLERIKQNGAFDRRIEVYNEAIIRAEDRLTAYETRLRKRFERLEVQLSQLQSQSAALEQALAQNAAQTGSSNG